MHTKGLLLFCLTFILVLQLTDQTNTCGKKCPPGVDCCRAVFSPLSFISKYKNTICGTKYCRSGEACIKKVCVKIDPPKPQKLPKPTEYGALDRAVSPYATYYCHENIYNLCKLFDRVKKPGVQGYAVIIRGSEPDSSAIIRQQKNGRPSQDYANFWNYHVIFLQKDGENVRVYDFDSKLQWGVDFQEAWVRALKTSDLGNLFRVIEYQLYLRFFSSTRSKAKKQVVDGKLTSKIFPTKDQIRFNSFGRQNQFRIANNFSITDPLYGNIMTASQFYRAFGKYG